MLATRKLRISHLISIRKTLGILQFLNHSYIDACDHYTIRIARMTESIPTQLVEKINLILVVDIVFG